MAYPPNSQDREDAFAEDDAWFRNFYQCGRCGYAWEDEWSCTCNDRCPTCGRETAPHKSEDMEGPS